MWAACSLLEGRSHRAHPDAHAAKVTFTVTLPAGKTKLQTWFADGAESRGAFYVYVKRL